MCEPPVDDPFGLQPPGAGPAESVDHDAHKPRATVTHCVAIIGCKVVRHLEGLARAREEKHLRPYQTDAEIHEQHILATTGGGFNAGEAANDAAEAPGSGPTAPKTGAFIPIPRNFDDIEMQKLLAYGYKPRLSAFAKELLALPSFSQAETLQPSADECQRKAALHARDMEPYAKLRIAALDDHFELREKQEAALEISKEEDNIERAPAAVSSVAHGIPGLAPDATFKRQTVYATPSALVRALIRALPPKERLTRDQTIFMVKFAAACDEAYEDMNKPPRERRPPTHLLLLGQGGPSVLARRPSAVVGCPSVVVVHRRPSVVVRPSASVVVRPTVVVRRRRPSSSVRRRGPSVVVRPSKAGAARRTWSRS